MMRVGCVLLPARSCFWLVVVALAMLFSGSDVMAQQPASKDVVNDFPPCIERPYPESRVEPIVEEQFGVPVADPYRWLEADVRSSREVSDWVRRQDEFGRSHLAALPDRDRFAASIANMYDRPRYGIPVRRGDFYFFTLQQPGQNQPVLAVREGLYGRERILVDPNGWAGKGARTLHDWEPSPDGRHVAYMEQADGSDWRSVAVVDVVTGALLPDRLEWVKFSNLAWSGVDSIVYSRFPAIAEQEKFQAANVGHSVYFHTLGTGQDNDRLLYTTPERADLNHVAEVTSDSRWIVVTSSAGTDDRHEVHILRSFQPETGVKALITGFADEWRLVDGIGDRLWFLTSNEAPMLRLVSVDVSRGGPVIKTVVGQRKQPLASAALVGRRFILTYLQDAQSAAELVSLNGRPVGKINLNWIGSAQGFRGRAGVSETFYRFSSFTRPGQIFRMDTENGTTTLFGDSPPGYDPREYVTEQRFFRSRDGTEIPMFLVYRRNLDLAKGVPTLLHGYGGFNVSLTPGFSEARMAWLKAGGVFAMVNLRGGGEYGKAWHDAGRLLKKQNVFDDFIFAAEYLIAQGITTKAQLAIDGRSNGGLLVAAVLNQRPDLFAAAHAAVGVMDMLRFHRFTAGRYWVDDYGHPDREEDFRNLLSYSPYHNIAKGAAYPALLVTTADTDDRVVPGHSFKYVARMQAETCGGPHLIRIERNAGHGSGKPVDRKIAEEADIYSFLAAWTGLKLTR